MEAIAMPIKLKKAQEKNSWASIYFEKTNKEL